MGHLLKKTLKWQIVFYIRIKIRKILELISDRRGRLTCFVLLMCQRTQMGVLGAAP